MREPYYFNTVSTRQKEAILPCERVILSRKMADADRKNRTRGSAWRENLINAPFSYKTK